MIYGPSLDCTVLEDADCPNESTWVELALRSQEKKEKLRKILDSSRRAFVVVEGEFYGPPLPDPKLRSFEQRISPKLGASRSV